MNSLPRRARLSALAKINLSLKVLHKRPDGFHELRTIFQTVSLADTLDVEFTPGPATSIEVTSDPDIPGNLVGRAAELAFDLMRATGRLSIRLKKRIPMGAGLGGGSSDAAAVLLALPVLAGRTLPLPVLLNAAACLGSDVPFFLLGGTAVATGRGTELYPLPDRRAGAALLVAPDIHVSTAEAYQALNRPDELTSAAWQNMISSFQSDAWDEGTAFPGENDFEPVVFLKHPRLKILKQQLERLGADRAMLSGSGAALFGLFADRRSARRAAAEFPGERVFVVSLLRRASYRALWWRRLGEHISQKVWPPQSRYA